METNIGLQTFRETLKYTIHVNTISVCPSMLKNKKIISRTNFSEKSIIILLENILRAFALMDLVFDEI